MNEPKPTSKDLDSLFHLCNMICWLLSAFVLVQVVFFVTSWMVPMPLTIGTTVIQVDPDGMLAGSVRDLTLAQKAAGIAIGLPGLVALTYGIIQLGNTVMRFQLGQIFAIKTIAHLRTSAGAIFIGIVLYTLEKPLRWLAFNALDDTKHYAVWADMTSNELLLILVCSLLYLISRVMHEGRRLSEENEGFI